MFNESNFIARLSGRLKDTYYIDYCGVYKVTDISKASGIEASVIREKYVSNGGQYDESQDVFYFNTLDSAKNAISHVLKALKPESKGRILYLSESEIEYIRKALINENSNTIHVSNKVKDSIFKKLNG